ncbi:MAG: type VI secretion system baseplate subunit TssF [Acidobacteria bacterium]|nr:type VI secretion system baseplate subunit TssF [Acidobacteriota bacterium]
MRDELLFYYERELTFLRQMGAEFAEKYPKIASRLLLEPAQCEDPHVERLLEAFAFLAARVHLKIDDEFPEITEAMLSIVYPHFIRPIPSMTIVELHTDMENAGLVNGLNVPRGTGLQSRPVDGLPMRFQTTQEVKFWPLQVGGTQWKSPDRLNPPPRLSAAAAALRAEFRVTGQAPLEKLPIESLTFYLNGESATVNTLYELLSHSCQQILLRDLAPASRKQPVVLPPSALIPGGFAENEAMLPYPRRSFEGYRLVQEYFHCPEKFFFFTLTGLDALRTSGFKGGFELVFLIDKFERFERMQQLEVGVDATTLKLNCTPVVNLFPQTAEPILLTQNKTEYTVVPDVRRQNAMEVFSIQEVLSANATSGDITYFEPFYSYRHGTVRDKRQTFWHAVRRPSTRSGDEGTEVSISLVDLLGRPMKPDFDALTLRTICTNRDLPARMPIGNQQGDLESHGMASIRKAIILRKLTPTVRPPTGKGAMWRLISHLSLNHLSLVDEGREALQEILRLYEYASFTHLQKQIAGISELNSKREFARLISENGITFARGTAVNIELDEDQFVGAGGYLFAALLDRFLALYTTMNSFTRVTVRTKQRREVLGQWPPRAGRQILV